MGGVADWFESAEAIARVDDLLASVGLQHGRRETRAGAWQNGERKSAAQRSPPPSRRRGDTGPVEIVRVPGWSRLPWLTHGFATRAGGVSTAYGGRSLNLGWTQADDPANVAANRKRFLKALAPAPGRGAHLVTLRQIHSARIHIVGRDADGALRAEGSPIPLTSQDGRATLKGDALMTDIPGVLLAVGAADCVPVLVADVRRRAVAAFHAGWRGTLARIVERGIGRMRLRFGSRPEDLVAVIGPSIGPCCYAVGEDLRFDFDSQFAYAPTLFHDVYDSDPVREKYPLLFLTARAPGHSNIGPQVHLDLWEANRRQLLDAGLKPARISTVRECTACTRSGPGLKYFSHRGENGFSGRGMGAIGVAP
ncbi:MAG: peptidoglycan editing factor PgeF [Acidobacteriota bacterium]|nr:peptidoglycan editing factor PgeF [Acidobacteriota bacterium]